MRTPADADAGPIFVGGETRSGKTLIRWILSSHPRIAVSRRTEMWPRFYGRFGELDRPQNLERCLVAMLERRHIAELGTDLDRLRRDFRDGPATYPRLFGLLHEQYAERSGKARWGDQTGRIERFAEQLLAAYRAARVIHLIRDPRDRAAALLEPGPRRRGWIGPATASWIRSAELAVSNRDRFAHAYLPIRYEDLVARPEATVRDLCAFLGEAFDPAMLRLEGVRRYDGERAASGGDAISAAYVGRYGRLLDRRDVAFIQAATGRHLAEFGYALDPVRLGPGERIRYAASWPLDRTLLGSERVRDALRRRPSPRTTSTAGA